MKRTLLLTISLACAGCGVSRQAAKSARTLVRDTTSVGTTITADDRTGRTQHAACREQDEEVMTETLVFDTSLPADPATGLPPLRQRTTQTRRTATRTRQQTAAESAETRTRSVSREKAGHMELKSAAETASRRGMTAAQRTLCTLGLLSAAAVAAWLLLRRWLR